MKTPTFRRPVALASLIGALFVTPLLLAAPEKPVEISLRTLSFTPELQIQEAYVLDPGEEAAAPVKTTIKSYLNHESLRIKTKSHRLAFITTSDKASLSKEGEFIGDVSLPEKSTSVLLVFLPNKAGEKASRKIVAVDDSKQAFPAGSYYMANVTAQATRLTLETTDYEFAPDQGILITKPPLRDDGNCGMRAFIKKDNEWKQISSGLWSSPGNGRSLKFFFETPGTGKVQLRSFDDVAPRESEGTGASSKGKKAGKSR